DSRQVFLFLFFVAKGDDGGTGQPFADMADPAGTTRAGVFFMEDHLLLDAGAAAAVLLGPADAGPAALGQLLFPDLALLGEHMFIAGTAAKPDLLEFAGEILFQPIGHFGAELLVLGTECQFHCATSV